MANREKTPAPLDGTVKENEKGLTITQKGFHQRGKKIGEVKIKKYKSLNI